ncbi:MAG TPA: hypothetical protein VJN21_15260 [Candidatus Acidoferrales bacterium]|nr:hypothetical protein [Candidatus Acidoferrales bacterium]
MSPLTAKLDFNVSNGKQTTSQFLIDNFRACFSLAAPKQPAAKAGLLTVAFAKAGHSSLAASLRPVSDFANSTYDFFNRQYVELEPRVSARKQTIDVILIAKNRHMLAAQKQAAPLLLTGHTSRITNHEPVTRFPVEWESKRSAGGILI